MWSRAVLTAAVCLSGLITVCEGYGSWPVSACPAIGCANQCANGYVKDSRGCDTCSCKPQPYNGNNCPPYICSLYCQNGFEKDSNGCDVCQCRSDPIWNGQCPVIGCSLSCSYGYAKDKNGCEICQCYPELPPYTPVVACSPPLCFNYCPQGREVGPQGCPTCLCRTSPTPSPTSQCSIKLCKNYCFNGRELDSNGCDTCNCKGETATPSPTVPYCPAVLCQTYCAYGSFTDNNGCPSCNCKPAPSNPVPRQCPWLQCNNFCFFGRKQDSNGCETCNCKRLAAPLVLPLPTWNNPGSWSLDRPVQVQCPLVRCSNSCPQGLWKVDSRRCPTCECQLSTYSQNNWGWNQKNSKRERDDHDD